VVPQKHHYSLHFVPFNDNIWLDDGQALYLNVQLLNWTQLR